MKTSKKKINMSPKEKKVVKRIKKEVSKKSTMKDPPKTEINEDSNNFKRLLDRFHYLSNLPQPEQRSQQWYDFRNNMITASDIGTIIGINKYAKSDEVLKKKCFVGTDRFFNNLAMHHGKKYEDIATQIYSVYKNTTVKAFGLIKHDDLDFIGASPDGINDKLTLDGKFNELIGRMLEIKCPMTRKINLQGKIYGDIVMPLYWSQMQIQMEVCELDTCDFLQCEIVEINDIEYFNLKEKSIIYDAIIDGEMVKENREIHCEYNKGMIVQLKHKKKPSIYDSKYLYPNMYHNCDYNSWLKEIKNTVFDEYVFDKVLYWKLNKAHLITIPRNKTWFASIKGHLTEFWNKIKFYRENHDKLKEDYKHWFVKNTIECDFSD